MKKAFYAHLLLPAFLLVSTLAMGQLSGNYTINSTISASATNFTSFSMAADSLNTHGVSGAVYINVNPDTYVDSMVVDTIKGSSSVNTVTIDGGSASTTTITHGGAVNNAVILLSGADNITIKNLTIENTKSVDDAWGIMLMNRADHVIIDSCTFNMATITAFEDIAAIVASGSVIASSTGGDNAHWLTISNCAINRGYYGIRLEGGNSSNGDLDSNITIHNNVLIDNIGFGVSLDDIAKLTMTDNWVSGAGLSSKDGYGIDDLVEFTITGNYAHVMDYGLEIDDGNYSVDGTPSSTTSLIANNMFISTDDDAINLDDVENINVYHNTAQTQGLDVGDIAFYFSDGDTLDIRNNIFVADEDHAIQIGTSVGLYTADYNIYYTGGSKLANISGSDRNTLIDWKLADATKNVNSLEGDPGFASSTDLHVIGTLADDVADNATPIVVDYDGQVRPAAGSTVKDIGADEYDGPSCAPPSGFISYNETSSSTMLAWTTGGASNWMVQYGTSGFTPGSGMFLAASNDTILLGGLTPQTTYDVYVKDSCGVNDVSPWLGPLTFATTCLTDTIPYLEEFNSGSFPVCWSRSSTTDVHVVASCSGRSNVLEFNYTEEATTATIDASGVQSISVGYFIGAGACTNDPEDNEHFQVFYWNGSQWIMAKDYDGTMPQSFVWDTFIVPQSDLTSEFKVKFDMIDGTTDAWQIDSVVIEEGPSCVYPSSIGAFNITSSSADVYWTTGGASAWVVQYDSTGFTLGTGITVSATNDTISLSGLTAQTTYDVYVKDSCSTTSTSTWAGPFSFTTPCNAFVAPYTESFDGNSTPACWSQTAVTGGPWVFSGSTNASSCGAAVDHTGNNGSFAWMDHSSTDVGVSLITGIVDVSALTIPYLEFYYWMCNSVTPPNELFVEAFNGSTWTPIDTIVSGATSWTKYDYVLTNYTYGSNLVQIRFRAESGGSGIDYNADQALDDVSIMEAPSCLVSSNLSAFGISNSEATITWNQGGSASNWMVQYGVSGFTPGTGTFVPTTNDTITLTGLMSQTTYDVYVKDSCNATTTSVLLGPLSFTTLCSPIIAPYTENFDSLALQSPYRALPDCWDSQTGPDYWDVTDGSVNNGHTYLPITGDHTSGTTNYMWIDASGDITGNAMVTGSIDISTLTAPYAGFWFASNNVDNSINHTISLDAWDGSSWVNINTKIGNFASWVEVSGVIPASIPDTTKFRIQAIANPNGTSGDYYYNDLGVDDFFVIEAPTCPAPTNLGVYNITSSSADVFWTTGGSMYHQIEYGPSGFNQGTGMKMTLTNDTTSLTGLFALTAYDVYVRDSCGATDVSTWSGPLTFNTLCNSFVAPFTESFELGSPSVDCWNQEYVSGTKNWSLETGSSGGMVTTANGGNRNARFTSSSGGPHITKAISPTIDASALTAPQLDFAYAQEVWAGDQNYLNVYYRDSANGAWNLVWSDSTSKAAWTPATVAIPSTSATLQLAFEGVDNFGYAVVVDDVVLAETPSCPDPTALGAFNITASSAQVFWTGSGSGLGYSIEYGPAGFVLGTGLTMSAANDTATLMGLMSNTAYEFYVQDSCGSALLSNISGPFAFNTLCGTFTAPFMEDFEASTGTTTCWSQEYVTGIKDWTFATGSSGGLVTSANSGTVNARFTSSNGGPHITKLISPAVDASALTGTELSFAYAQETWAGDQNFLNVYYRDSANGSWMHLWSDSTNQASWVTEAVIIPSTSATLQVAFEGVDDWGRANVVDDVEIKQAPSCPPSINLGVTNITTTSAELYWTSVSGASKFIIEYGPAGFIPCTGASMFAYSTNDTLVLTNLLPSVTYDFYVIDSCGVGNNSGCGTAGPVTFATLCNTFMAPFFEDFEVATGSSSCWSQTQVSGSSDWTVATGSSGGSVTAANSGSLNMRHTSSSGGPNITMLISPVIDASTLLAPELSFAYAQEAWAGDQNFLDVYYRDSATGAWNHLWSDSTSQAAWTTAAVTVPSTSATLQFGFQGTDNWGRAVVVDDVSLSNALTCDTPDSLMAMAGCDNATVTWTSEAGANSTVEYGPAGFSIGSGMMIPNAVSPQVISGLMLGTAYDFYVIDTCSNSAVSMWSTAAQFTTDTMPIASFTAMMNAAPHPDTVQYSFDAMASVNANKYYWNFGDGPAIDSSGANVTHNYGQNGTYTVVLIVRNDCGMDTATFEVVIEGIGLDEYGFGNISIYPNPSNGLFTIAGITNFGDQATVEVISMAGTIIYSSVINANNSETVDIDLRGFAQGLYQVRVSNAKGVSVKPIIIRN